MIFFRRDVDLTHATTRIATLDDLPTMSRLLSISTRRHYALSGDELPELLHDSLGVVLEVNGTLYGCIVVNGGDNQTTWICVVALLKGVNLSAALHMLLPALHVMVQAHDIKHVFYAGEATTDEWFIPALQQHSYVRDTEVLTYEKRALDIPSTGNQQIAVRPATHFDVKKLYALDRFCFEPQWTKQRMRFQEALEQTNGVFLVAERERHLIGFMFATTHFDGKLTHLVRIAVDPYHQGQGIGVRLLADIVMYARGKGTEVITLNTQAYNYRAQQLYRWFGFVATGERQPIMRYDVH